MTWGEFKKQVEAQGVKDDDVINIIDYNVTTMNKHIIVEPSEDGVEGFDIF